LIDELIDDSNPLDVQSSNPVMHMIAGFSLELLIIEAIARTIVRVANESQVATIYFFTSKINVAS